MAKDVTVTDLLKIKNEALEQGRQEERAAVVAHLRHSADEWLALYSDERSEALLEAAREIESCEHHTAMAPGCSSCEHRARAVYMVRDVTVCDHPDIHDVEEQGRELSSSAAPSWCPLRKLRGKQP